MASFSRLITRALGLVGALCLLAAHTAHASVVLPPNDARVQTPSQVSVAQQPDGSWQYLVNGQPRVFIGMGYDPIYRYLSTEGRAANYQRDFQLLHDAGVNTITGWDADKGYDQDKFDELTLSIAEQHDIGVVMPLNLPPGGDYTDPTFVQSLLDEARSKVERFKDYPALRMWGVGNEVFWDMNPEMWPAFEDAYRQIADLFHQLDPAHPVIYREAEMAYVPEFADMLRDGAARPWLLYGMNVYNKDPGPLLDQWASFGLDRPMLVSEFGTQGDTPELRARGYVAMWHAIRCAPSYVLGGAPYVWTTAGPEPTDTVWGLMDANGQPVDGTFAALTSAWRVDTPGMPSACSAAAP
ncbi:MAG TPA: glycoside hydrolase family 2 TIM barrel-domain containing protein, partial [Chloroflexota bacterium]|nr:glycoside hydrolase family 2 TIM barrel-domain containing protein [Chloroflexota bacterium]